MQSVLHRLRSSCFAQWLGLGVVTGLPSLAAAQTTPSAGNALPAVRDGVAIYAAACTTCHGADGAGASPSALGFDIEVDFRDCAFATAEPDPDWFAVVHQGGPIRGLDRRMPAFGDALSSDDITMALGHVRTFCRDQAWPRGDLNFPRAFFTEKAFPENESLWTTFADGDAVANTLIYERRLGARNQFEVSVPLDVQQSVSGAWVGGIGDIAIGFKRALFHNVARGVIASAGAEVALPTGSEDRGLGAGVTIVEPFAMWGWMLPANSFLQMHGGVELPTDTAKASREAFLRTAVGTTFAQDGGFGRAWSPQVELLWARPSGSGAEWDVVPQLQVSLSKLQHVLIAGGVRIPLNQREERHTQALVYFLWDWFDGGLFEFWK